MIFLIEIFFDIAVFFLNGSVLAVLKIINMAIMSTVKGNFTKRWGFFKVEPRRKWSLGWLSAWKWPNISKFRDIRSTFSQDIGKTGDAGVYKEVDAFLHCADISEVIHHIQLSMALQSTAAKCNWWSAMTYHYHFAIVKTTYISTRNNSGVSFLFGQQSVLQIDVLSSQDAAECAIANGCDDIFHCLKTFEPA